MQNLRCLFFINIDIFRHSKPEIALANPASNECKIEKKQFSSTRLNDLRDIIMMIGRIFILLTEIAEITSGKLRYSRATVVLSI